jgi:hypothetical protein
VTFYPYPYSQAHGVFAGKAQRRAQGLVPFRAKDDRCAEQLKRRNLIVGIR